MKSSQLKQTLAAMYHMRRPVFLWGAPGIGKSAVFKQVHQDLKKELKIDDFGWIDFRAILHDTVDMKGIPSVVNGITVWNVPDFLPKSGFGILLVDELNAAPPSVQAALYQLILDRRLGDYVLPDGWVVFAAGNRETDRAVTNRMPTPLANRFVHLNLDIDLQDWVEWALNNNVLTETISFIRFRPALLHAFDPTSNAKAFPTPRSWEFVSDVMKSSLPKELEYEVVSGTVGEAAASEFIGFMRIFRSLPSPDVILLSPDTATVPDDPATLYALCGALTAKASIDNFDRLMKYVNRMPTEFSVLLVRDCVTQKPELAETRAFIDWSIRNKDVLI